MFLINDTLAGRQKQIRRYLATDPAVAVMLAAADFEWTVRRAILALGKDSTKDIRAGVLASCSGLGKYKQAWNKQVKPRYSIGLPAIVPDWNLFIGHAYQLRHRLVHGVVGTTSSAYANKSAEAILAASKAVADFADANGEPIYGRRIVRYKAR